jgi:hypothetical protein
MAPHVKQVFENPASEEQIRAFQEWERRDVARMLVRYSDFPVKSAFGLRPSDVVTVNDAIRFELNHGETRLLDHAGRCIGRLIDVPMDLLKRLLQALDGKPSVRGARAATSNDARNIVGRAVLGSGEYR